MSILHSCLAYKSTTVFDYSQTIWDPYTSGGVPKIESFQRRAVRYTLNRYHRTSSVSAMIAQLDWHTLADRRRVARLLMFYKIHYHLITIDMPLSPKLHLQPTRTENMLAYFIPSSYRDYHRNSFFPRTVREWNILPQEVIQLSTAESFKNAVLSM